MLDHLVVTGYYPRHPSENILHPRGAASFLGWLSQYHEVWEHNPLCVTLQPVQTFGRVEVLQLLVHQVISPHVELTFDVRCHQLGAKNHPLAGTVP